MALTDVLIRGAKPREKAYKIADEKGLYLLVKPNGSKLWRLKYRFAGKEKKFAIGAYPVFKLHAARERQIDLRRQIATGVDPAEVRKQTRRSAVVAASNTFEAVGREWFAKFSKPWAKNHSSKILLRLENDLYPWLGKRPISAIEPPELLAVLRRIEKRGALETAHRCLSYCSRIFRYAIASGLATRDPAADLKGALATPEHGHFPAVTEPDAVGELMRAVYGYHGSLITRCGMKLLALTFIRTHVLRKADPKHFNLEKAEWRIPGRMMKMKNDLIVPLSRQAVEVVRELMPLTGNGEYLFPSERTRKRPMSNNTMNAALRRMGYTDEMCGHGFRAMARTLLDEELEYRPDWIDHQLAHRVKDTNGRAYNRTKYLKQRREMLQQWADYLDQLRLTLPKSVPLVPAKASPRSAVKPNQSEVRRSVRGGKSMWVRVPVP